MNILIVSEGAYPEVFGGSQTCFYEISRRLAARGHVVYHLTASTDRTKPRQESLEGVTLIRYFLGGKHQLVDVLTLPFSLIPALRAVTGQKSFDLVLLHHVESGFWASFFCPKLLPIVYYFHSPWYLEFKIRKERSGGPPSPAARGIAFILKSIQAAALRPAGRIIVESDYMKKNLFEMDPSLIQKPVHNLPPGIDLDRFRPAVDREAVRVRLGFKKSSFILLTVRRLVPRMGIDLLMDALPTILKKYPETSLCVIGKGEMKAALKDHARRLGLDRAVHFPGAVAAGDLISYYQAADLFVIPSLDLEGFGLVTLEALACGTPVVGTKVGGTKEILEKLDQRFLVDEPSAEKIAQGILRWMENPEELSKMRSRVRQFVEDEYSWEREIEALEKIFDQAVEAEQVKT